MVKTIRAIALQTKIELEYYKNRTSFEAFLKREMEKIKRQLSDEDPNLVVFPEDIGTPLVTMGNFNAVKDCRTMDEAISKISKRSMDYVLVSKIRHRASGAQAVFFSKESTMRKTYETVFSSLSQEYGAYILAGTIVLPPEKRWTPAATGPLQTLRTMREATKKGRLYNTAYLFSPNGDVLIRQRKVNLIPLEEDLGISKGELVDLQPYTIEGITIGITICYDAFFPEIVKQLAESGARILVDPSANPEPWTDKTEEENKKGLYARVQEEAEIKYGIQAMLTGKLFGITFEGKSSIVTKKQNTPDMTGIICQAKRPDEPEALVADLTI
ncbi:MAG: nitrilase-related carbon-nitrogen hydrolase [Thermoproteota archaeon]